MEYKVDTLIPNESTELRDFLLNIKEAFVYFKKKLWFLLLVSFIGATIAFAFAYFSKPLYVSKVKFIMKDNGGGSSLMSSLGSLGSLIGGSSGPVSPLDRTLAILGSERIVGKALLNSIVVDNKTDLAINHFIRIAELDKKWKKDSILNNVAFKNGDNIFMLSYSKRKAYKIITKIFLGEKSIILSKNFDKKSGVFTLSVNSNNESFSIEFCKLLYSELEQFTYNQQLSSSGKNVEILDKKIDSIKAELNSVQNSLARNTDRTLGLLMQEDKVDQKKLLLREQMLTIMYGEAQKNLETFRFVNESINKGLEIIEYPLSPIVPEERSLLKYSLIGFLISGIICFFILYTRKWIKEKLMV